jgi:hypothetical protein
LSALKINHIGNEPPSAASALLKAELTAFDVNASFRPIGVPWGFICNSRFPLVANSFVGYLIVPTEPRRRTYAAEFA